MRPFLYARFRPDRLSVRLVGSDLQWEDTPDVAVDTRSGALLAVGRSAMSTRDSFVGTGNGFQSERTVIGDIDLAEIALRHAVHQILAFYHGRFFYPLLERKPDLLLHPLAVPRGGLNSFEVRGLQSMGSCVGARKTYIWVGHELSDAEIRSGVFRPRPVPA